MQFFILYSETDKHLRLRSREPLVFFPLTFNKATPSVESYRRDHLFCDHSPYFNDFIILVHGTDNFLLEIIN